MPFTEKLFTLIILTLKNGNLLNSLILGVRVFNKLPFFEVKQIMGRSKYFLN